MSAPDRSGLWNQLKHSHRLGFLSAVTALHDWNGEQRQQRELFYVGIKVNKKQSENRITRQTKRSKVFAIRFRVS